VAKPSVTLDRLRANITWRLQIKGVRQGQMAKALGMTDSWISGVLSGKRAISFELIDRLADYFECAPAALFDALDETPPRTIVEGAGYATQTRVLKRIDDQRRADRHLMAQLWARNQHLQSQLDDAIAVIGPLHAHLTAVRESQPAVGNASSGHRHDAHDDRAGASRRRRSHRAAGR
jgi:transcriptional regulator with XRE-family HTH domain